MICAEIFNKILSGTIKKDLQLRYHLLSHQRKKEKQKGFFLVKL